MALIRDGRPFVIYALVCPLTLEVKYVGQTIDLEQRTRGKRHMMGNHHAPLTEWQRSLGYLGPYKVILERGVNRRVAFKSVPRPKSTRGRKYVGTDGMTQTWLSTWLEAKWIKRFRRTILNKNKNGQYDASLLLINPPLPWEK